MNYYKNITVCFAILTVSLNAENMSDQNVTIIKIIMPQVVTPVKVTAKVPKPLTDIPKVDILVEKAVDATTDIKKSIKSNVVVATPTKKIPSANTATKVINTEK